LNFFEYGYVNRKSVPRNRKNDCSPGKKFRGEYSPFLFNGSMFLQLLYRHGTRLSSRSYYDRTICSFIGTTGRRHTFFFQSRPGSFLNSQYPSTYKLQVGRSNYGGFHIILPLLRTSSQRMVSHYRRLETGTSFFPKSLEKS
jgi:hypothetical protein